MDTFTKSGEKWSVEEDNQLNKLYNDDLLDILEIAKIHERSPGGIISRLSKHNYITDRKLARGYLTYKNSDLYKDIVSNKINSKKSDSKNDFLNLQNDVRQMKDDIIFLQLQNDVRQMKDEIISLKKTINELSKIVKNVYEDTGN